jgi:hypothetical protein
MADSKANSQVSPWPHQVPCVVAPRHLSALPSRQARVDPVDALLSEMAVGSKGAPAMSREKVESILFRSLAHALSSASKPKVRTSPPPTCHISATCSLTKPDRALLWNTTGQGAGRTRSCGAPDAHAGPTPGLHDMHTHTHTREAALAHTGPLHPSSLFARWRSLECFSCVCTCVSACTARERPRVERRVEGGPDAVHEVRGAVAGAHGAHTCMHTRTIISTYSTHAHAPSW